MRRASGSLILGAGTIDTSNDGGDASSPARLNGQYSTCDFAGVAGPSRPLAGKLGDPVRDVHRRNVGRLLPDCAGMKPTGVSNRIRTAATTTDAIDS